MTIRNILLAAAAAISMSATAITLDEAKAAFAAGKYEVAAPELKAAADREPRNAALNAMAGEALLHIGKGPEATKYLERGGAAGQLGMAKYRFGLYDFDEAEEWLDKYFTAKYKDKDIPDDDAGALLGKRIELGRSMLDRVEKIAVIDSFTVSKDDFLRVFRLSAPTGSLHPASYLPETIRTDASTAVYVTENGEHMLWGQPDDKGRYHLVETSLLADGSWEKPSALPGAVNTHGADSNYPFLMSDGVTLYFATNDPEISLGGYDIFISRNDGDRYLEPQNVGMPYNSTADDYMLAIDEITGAGWWVTDRNNIPGRLTVYLFVPEELRVNYPPDTPGLTDLARLSSIAATHKPGVDYSALRSAIASIPAGQSADQDHNAEFTFALPDGTILHSLADFESDGAAAAMENYLDKMDEFSALKQTIERQRQQYAGGDTSVTDAILQNENKLEKMRTELRRLSNNIITAETGIRTK
ncbi:MAG: tetratricopeptide repeat protein [Muribaculaceae bacterium]|nr:tetratricopeptide repeat protein [Muribaculaceae bacterium]